MKFGVLIPFDVPYKDRAEFPNSFETIAFWNLKNVAYTTLEFQPSNEKSNAQIVKI